MTRLAFLGPRATFTEQALLSLPESDGAELMPCVGTTAALAAVRSGAADAACVPIENSVEGGVPSVLDSLVTDPPLVIVREAQVAVEFALMARPGISLADIRSVSSHPHGEAQTRHWLAANLPKAAVLMSSSTAEAAAQAARGEVDASVSAPVAATVHGLKILADDIADNAAAVTRFVLVRPPGPPPAPTALDRTTLAATTENRPGALLGVLTELAVRGIDLTRIESRPIKGRRDEYWFHLDCTGHVAQP
ncbi:MAG TPA: prephenate dehydratase, partial [Pseudonocardia sp.]|nr:prephenate dehydratase [Pseudonocardia sp.]